MAKGSGGVGKGKGSSVSGAPVAPALANGGGVALPAKAANKFGPNDITAANLATVAKALPASDKFHGRAFLGPLLAQFGTTPQAAQKALLELHMNDKVNLSRADLVDAMNPKLVAASAISRPGTNYTYHLIDFDV